MALQSSFFGNKREPVPARLASATPLPGVPEAEIPLSLVMQAASPASAAVAMPPLAGAQSSPAATAQPAPLPFPPPGGALQHTSSVLREAAAFRAQQAVGPATESPSKLTVGPNIKLKGVEITDCDTLVVEGTVEATMDSRVMQIERKGEFNGSARVELAIIKGSFHGTLDARKQLVIHSSGKVSGTVRYGSLVVEEGGQLIGDIHFGADGVV